MIESGAGPTTGVGRLLRRVFAALDDAAVPCCVLHGYETFPDVVPSDVDCLMPAEILPRRLASLLHERRDDLEAEVVQWIADGAHYVVLAGRDADGAPALLPLHISTDFMLRGRVLFAGEEILGRSRPRGSFRVPSPALEFTGVLANKAVKGRLSDDAARRLVVLYARDGAGCRQHVARFWSARSATRILDAVGRDDLDAIREDLRRLRAELLGRTALRHPLATCRHWIGKMTRRLRRWSRPRNGLHVVFLGPDGVGKSTVIEAVQGHLGRAFLRTEYHTFAPSLIPGARPRPPGMGPHALPPRSLPASLAKAVWWFLCYTVGYALTIHPALARSRLVIGHRYLLDALVDPGRYRYRGPLALLRLIWRIAPKPHLIILLDAPADVIHARKQEVAPEEIRRQRESYRSLVGPLASGHIVDAARPLEEVVADVDRIILTYLAARTARDLGLGREI